MTSFSMCMPLPPLFSSSSYEDSSPIELEPCPYDLISPSLPPLKVLSSNVVTMGASVYEFEGDTIQFITVSECMTDWMKAGVINISP